jgi:hypothetical protein
MVIEPINYHRHGVGLALSGNAQQHLMLLGGDEAPGELVDGASLISPAACNRRRGVSIAQ